MSTPITTRYLVGPPELRGADSSELATFGNIADAVTHADKIPGSQVYRCEPMPESGLWEWTVTPPGELPQDNYTYVNERAARKSAGPHDTVWKARAGRRPLQWQPADHSL